MKVSDLVRLLDQLRHMYISAGATGPGKDFLALMDTLAPYESLDLAVFLNQAREGLSAPKGGKRKPSEKKAVSSVEVDADLITKYVAALKGVGTNQVAFDKLFAELKTDKKLRLKELTEVAHQYSGGVSKYRTIAAAQTEISKSFVKHARFVNKLG